MSEYYAIQKGTLTEIAEAVRKKFNFIDTLKPQEIPHYISSEANMFWLTHFNCNAEAGGVIITSAEALAKVNYDYRLWVTFIPDETYPNYYTISAIINNLSLNTANSTQPTFPTEGGFLYNISYGTNYPYWGSTALPNYQNVNTNNAVKNALQWQVGDKFIFENLNLDTLMTPTSTPDILWYKEGYNCTATYDKIGSYGITIDGYLNDDGWSDGGWYVVNGQTGVYQAEPTVGKGFDYRYKIRTDSDYLYVAVAANEHVMAGAAGPSAARIWLKTNPDATVYTHFYETRWNSNGLYKRAMINQSTTTNNAIEIADTSMEYASSYDSGVVRFEFRVKLSEFGGEEGFYYFFDFSQASFSSTLPSISESTNIASGKSYTASDTDYVGGLTDGILPANADESNWSSWYGIRTAKSIIVDLTAEYGLYHTRMWITNGAASAGIGTAKSIKVYISVNNVDFFPVGEFEINFSRTDGNGYWVDLDLANLARYVRFDVVPTSSWCFIGEIEVYGGIDGYESLDLYAQPITIGADTRTENFPYKKWEDATAIYINPTDIEITADEALSLIEEALA